MYINKEFWVEINNIIEKFLDTNITLSEAKEKINAIIKEYENKNGELSISIDVDSIFNIINRSDFDNETLYSYNYDDDDVNYKDGDDIYGDDSNDSNDVYSY